MIVELIKNINLEPVPKTPATPFIETSEVAHIGETLVSYGLKYGRPISYAQEQKGVLIQNILPIYKTETQQISTSSKVTLGLHTETAFHPYKPDYVLLLCLRGDPTAVTTYASIEDILFHVPEYCLEILKKKWFVTGIDISFRSNGEEDQEIPVSILSENEDGISFIYDETIIKGINPEANDALAILHRVIPLCVKEVVLEAGDLLVINNNKVIHGRKPFQPRYDGTDRWVQRLLVRKSLPPKSEINGHIITTTF